MKTPVQPLNPNTFLCNAFGAEYFNLGDDLDHVATHARDIALRAAAEHYFLVREREGEFDGMSVRTQTLLKREAREQGLEDAKDSHDAFAPVDVRRELQKLLDGSTESFRYGPADF